MLQRVQDYKLTFVSYRQNSLECWLQEGREFSFPSSTPPHSRCKYLLNEWEFIQIVQFLKGYCTFPYQDKNLVNIFNEGREGLLLYS